MIDGEFNTSLSTNEETERMYNITCLFEGSEEMVGDIVKEGSFAFLEIVDEESLKDNSNFDTDIIVGMNVYPNKLPLLNNKFAKAISINLPDVFVFEETIDKISVAVFDDLKKYGYKIFKIKHQSGSRIVVGSKIGTAKFNDLNSFEPTYLQIARRLKKLMDKTNSISRSRKDKIQKYELQQKQSLPLEIKIQMSLRRIQEWYEAWDGQVYVSFSGGKDSTVLLHLVRSLYPNVEAVFADTGLEYPEIRAFVKSISNIVWMQPQDKEGNRFPFKRVLEEYGYPVVSKKIARYIRDLQNPTEDNKAVRNLRLTGYNRKGKYLPSMILPKKWMPLVDSKWKISEQCCDVMKKEPFHRYVKETGKKGINGVMACESDRREKDYLHNGCNAFHTAEPLSSPLAFWTEQDVLRYLKEFNIPYASVYGEIVEDENRELITTGERRTGCAFCLFGVHLEKGENRFQRMAKTHPKLYDYCIKKLGIGEILDFIKVDYQPIERTEQMKCF